MKHDKQASQKATYKKGKHEPKGAKRATENMGKHKKITKRDSIWKKKVHNFEPILNIATNS